MSLGLPESDKARTLKHAFGFHPKSTFHDATTCNSAFYFFSPSPCTDPFSDVENAFHALALDEKRASFSPMLWHLPEANYQTTNLQQCWFPGAHSDVGGSYDDALPYDSSDLSLLWMIRLCSPYLAFKKWHPKRITSKESSDIHVDWLGAQPLHDSYTWPSNMNGTKLRTPGQYHEKQHVAPPPTPFGGPLKEFVHASVRLRLLRARKGGVRVQGKTKLSDSYDCDAMVGFKLKLVDDSDAKKGYKWVNEEKGIELMEEPLRPEERDMLTPELLRLLDDQTASAKLKFPMK
jgi:hypothetical protein